MKLPRHMRMTEWREFSRVRREGRSFAGRHLVLGVLRDSRIGDSKFGFITTRRVGNAVTRNRIRRRMRAIVRDVGESLNHGYFVVTVARNPAAGASWSRLRSEWVRLARKAGVLRELPANREPNPS